MPVDPDLPRRPPVAVDDDRRARHAGQFVERDVERRRQPRGDGQHRLLLAALVAADLANVHAGALGEHGLRQPERPGAAPHHLAKVLHKRQYTPAIGG